VEKGFVLTDMEVGSVIESRFPRTLMVTYTYRMCSEMKKWRTEQIEISRESNIHTIYSLYSKRSRFLGCFKKYIIQFLLEYNNQVGISATGEYKTFSYQVMCVGVGQWGGGH